MKRDLLIKRFMSGLKWEMQRYQENSEFVWNRTETIIPNNPCTLLKAVGSKNPEVYMTYTFEIEILKNGERHILHDDVCMHRHIMLLSFESLASNIENIINMQKTTSQRCNT